MTFETDNVEPINKKMREEISQALSQLIVDICEKHGERGLCCFADTAIAVATECAFECLADKKDSAAFVLGSVLSGIETSREENGNDLCTQP